MGNLRPETFHLGEGRYYSLGPLTLAFKTSTASYTLFEAIIPPGSGAGLHRHVTFDQTQIVLEGRCELQFDDRMEFLGPGDAIFLPKEVIHGLTNLGPVPCRLVIITTPAGLLKMFVAEAAAALGGAEGPLTKGGSANFRSIAAKHGKEWLDADDRMILPASPRTFQNAPHLTGSD
jgi:mannose-6-phosphate isomerase-like protein (cupin superfamily)